MEVQEREDGKQPFRDWFFSLKDRVARNKIDARLRRVESGNLGYCEPVGDKSSQPRDIKTAQQYWADYRRRHG